MFSLREKNQKILGKNETIEKVKEGSAKANGKIKSGLYLIPAIGYCRWARLEISEFRYHFRYVRSRTGKKNKAYHIFHRVYFLDYNTVPFGGYF